MTSVGCSDPIGGCVSLKNDNLRTYHLSIIVFSYKDKKLVLVWTTINSTIVNISYFICRPYQTESNSSN